MVRVGSEMCAARTQASRTLALYSDLSLQFSTSIGTLRAQAETIIEHTDTISSLTARFEVSEQEVRSLLQVFLYVPATSI